MPYEEDEISSLEEKFTSGFFKKTSIDKLTYKNEIADAIRDCRKTMGLTIFPDKVKALMRTVSFDVSGYNLKSEIEDILIKVRNENNTYINHFKDKKGKDFYGRAFQAKLKITMVKKYYEYLFEELIQLLANHNLLFETEKRIPYKQLGRLVKTNASE